MEVEGVIAHTPGLVTFFLAVGDLVSLTVYTGLHDMVTADSAVIDMDVPGPESDGVPFFNFESFRWCCFDHFFGYYFSIIN